MDSKAREHNIQIVRQIAERYYELTEEEIHVLADIMEPVKFEKRKNIVKEGDIADTIYYITSGMVRSYTYKDGQQTTWQFDYEGHFIMDLESFLIGKSTMQYIEPLEPTECYAFKKSDLEKIARSSVNLQMLVHRIVEKSVIRVIRYIRFLRNENAAQRYCIMSEYHPEVVRRVPLMYIASFLHMTPETLSRIRCSQWKNNETDLDEDDKR